MKARRIPRAPRLALVDAGLEAGVISEAEAVLVREAEAARIEAVQVDAFDPGILSGSSSANEGSGV